VSPGATFMLCYAMRSCGWMGEGGAPRQKKCTTGDAAGNAACKCPRRVTVRVFLARPANVQRRWNHPERQGAQHLPKV
jgi:hypothetical protein